MYNKEYHRKYIDKNREHIYARNREYALENPRAVKSYKIKHRFGISLDEYEGKFKAQDGRCRICNTLMELGKFMHLDHDHTTGKLRDFLCHLCNKGLGHFKDSPDLLRAAAEYIIKHKETN